MSKGLDQEGSFITNFSKIADTLILCAIWLLCCIPIVTAGAASGALYYAYHKAIRQDKGHPYRAFFGAFKSNFWQATGIWLLMLLFTVMSLVTCYLLRIMRNSIPITGVFLHGGNKFRIFGFSGNGNDHCIFYDGMGTDSVSLSGKI